MNARQWINYQIRDLGANGRLTQKEATLKLGFWKKHIMDLKLNPETSLFVVEIQTSLNLAGAALIATVGNSCQTAVLEEKALPKMYLTKNVGQRKMYTQPKIVYKATFQGKLCPTDVRQIRFEFLPVS